MATQAITESTAITVQDTQNMFVATIPAERAQATHGAYDFSVVLIVVCPSRIET
jgi:hypothetical protein